MSTQPIASPSGSGFNWQLLLAAIESAGNTAVGILIPGGAVYAPLLMALEQAVNPLLSTIGQHPATSDTVMALFGTTIAVLNILKQQPGLPAAELAKVDEYLAAAQNGLAAYLLAEKGFDATQFAPVTPIA